MADCELQGHILFSCSNYEENKVWIIFYENLNLKMIERAIEQKRGLRFYLHLIHNELERGRQKMPQMMNWPQNMQILFSTTDK